MGSFSIFLGFYGEERVPALGYTKCYQVGCLKEYAYFNISLNMLNQN